MGGGEWKVDGGSSRWVEVTGGEWRWLVVSGGGWRLVHDLVLHVSI